MSAESGQSLSTGKSLTGWDGNPDHWVRMKSFSRKHKEKPTKGNTFCLKGGVLVLDPLWNTRSMETAHQYEFEPGKQMAGESVDIRPILSPETVFREFVGWEALGESCR